jgi:hypothetical protein
VDRGIPECIQGININLFKLGSSSKSSVKKITLKKYETKEFSFLCLSILNYCIVIVSVRYSSYSNHKLLVASVCLVLVEQVVWVLMLVSRLFSPEGVDRGIPYYLQMPSDCRKPLGLLQT